MTSGVVSPIAHDDESNSSLMQAFWNYESALMANDVATLDELFHHDEKTMRVDHSAVLLGYNAIAEFRARRTQGAPPRTITAVHVRELSDDTALVLAETCRRDGARGLQSQVWLLSDEGWRVIYAHVSAGAARDATVWRVVGAPLVPPTGNGTLSGLTVAVKDLFAIEGESIGGGTPTYLAHAHTESEHAVAVATLIHHGAAITGLAHTDELAYSLGGTNPHYGTPPNHAAPDRIPGGSSSGPASAVAGGEVDLGLGTDTAGSIRVPASYQGLWGFRPTHGDIDTSGVLPLAPSFDTVGLLARDLATVQAAADTLLPPGTDDEISTVVVDPALVSYADPAVAQSFWEALRIIRRRVRVEYRDVTNGQLEEWFTAFRTLQAFEAWQSHGDFLTEYPEAVAADVAARFQHAATITDRAADDARTVIARARDQLNDVVSASDVLLLPATSSAAPPRSADSAERARTATLHLTCLASLSGRPALSAPCLTDEGLPVGLSAVGTAHRDRGLLRFAMQHLTFHI
ncbi:AtzH-like domain-containing protein [uncultured Gordonia sp.]|uniref:AtzH-like domain-containing protein n=1 Tax=uncultured Gordonia sp. TaxID=198437 RepID=UPI0025832E96|nr:AtzH-like domain-containing protein [uncultured Gordonia sp.]